MGLEEKLLEQREATLIDDNGQGAKRKADYILDAEEGLILAFRLNFTAKSDKKLTKVISGKIIENNKEEEYCKVETKNKLIYEVPYESVVWVKTGNRWPRGVYEEMKRGSVEVKENEDLHFSELDEQTNI